MSCWQSYWTQRGKRRQDRPLGRVLIIMEHSVNKSGHWCINFGPFFSVSSEENVWKLCDKIRNEHPTEIDSCHVAFISNPKRMVPMWRQKSGKNEEKLALWVWNEQKHYVGIWIVTLSSRSSSESHPPLCLPAVSPGKLTTDVDWILQIFFLSKFGLAGMMAGNSP